MVDMTCRFGREFPKKDSLKKSFMYQTSNIVTSCNNRQSICASTLPWFLQISM